MCYVHVCITEDSQYGFTLFQGLSFAMTMNPLRYILLSKENFGFDFIGNRYATRHLVVYTGKNVEFYSRNCRNDEEKESILSTRWPYHIISGSRAIPPYHFFKLLLG